MHDNIMVTSQPASQQAAFACTPVLLLGGIQLMKVPVSGMSAQVDTSESTTSEAPPSMPVSSMISTRQSNCQTERICTESAWHIQLEQSLQNIHYHQENTVTC
jgi:hypothetical protein